MSRLAMSRRRRNVLTGLAALALLCLVVVDRSVHSGQQPTPNESAERAGIRDFAKYHGRTFTVARVVDGDTLDIDIPDGSREHTRIRLLGIDAPETMGQQSEAMYFGRESSEFARLAAEGKRVDVFLDTVANTRGKYGRLLAYVRLPDGDFLNETLIREGCVYADLRFRHGLYNRYTSLEAGSRAGVKGLWEGVTREKLPEWLQRKRPTFLRAR